MEATAKSGPPETWAPAQPRGARESPPLDAARRFERRKIPLLSELLRLPSFFRNYAGDSLRHHRRLGDVFERRLGAPSLYLCHPALARHVLRTNVRNYVKGPDYEILRPLLGDGIFVSEGELWTQQRRLLAPEFRTREVARFVPLINAECERLAESWRPSIERGEPIEMGEAMQHFALLVIGGAMFQSDFARMAKVIATAIETILTQATLRMISRGLLAPWLPTPGNHRAKQAERRLDEIVRYLAEDGHGTHSHSGCPIATSGVDMVSRMLVAEDSETGQQMSERQLLDEIKSLLLAGHETTGVALTWTLYLLARHRRHCAQATEEVDAVLGGRSPTIADVDKLVYLRQIVFESMRLYPPLPGVTRTALAEDSFAGIVVRAGESVTMQPYTLHRHHEFWPDPERFDPERFASDRVDQIDAFAYMPFLRGRRACLGEHFAMIELIVAMANLLTHFEFETVDDAPIGVRPITTLRPDRPMLLRVRRRAPKALAPSPDKCPFHH